MDVLVGLVFAGAPVDLPVGFEVGVAAGTAPLGISEGAAAAVVEGASDAVVEGRAAAAVDVAVGGDDTVPPEAPGTGAPSPLLLKAELRPTATTPPIANMATAPPMIAHVLPEVLG